MDLQENKEFFLGGCLFEITIDGTIWYLYRSNSNWSQHWYRRKVGSNFVFRHPIVGNTIHVNFENSKLNFSYSEDYEGAFANLDTVSPFL